MKISLKQEYGQWTGDGPRVDGIGLKATIRVLVTKNYGLDSRGDLRDDAGVKQAWKLIRYVVKEREVHSWL